MPSEFLNRPARARGRRRNWTGPACSPKSPNRPADGSIPSKSERTAEHRREDRHRVAQPVHSGLFSAEPGTQRQIPARPGETGAAARPASASGLLETGLLCSFSIIEFLSSSLGAVRWCVGLWASRNPLGQAEDARHYSVSDTRLVVLHTTVVDKTGHLVTDSAGEAFTVFENGVPQQIKVFKREDIPVSMGLIIDNSGSMRDKRAKVEAAALALVKDSNPEDEVFVVNFNDEAFLDLPHGKDFTNDIEEMEEALTRIDSRGGTAMRDAIRMSIDHLKEKAHKDKKVLVVVTDGNDN